jgi:hypothetical protein
MQLYWQILQILQKGDLFFPVYFIGAYSKWYAKNEKGIKIAESL